MCKQRSLPRHYHEFDVFVSSDEQRADIRKWIMTTLIPMLQREGIRVYVPMISLPLGAIRSEETERIIRKCHTFLVILSDGYFEDGSIWTSFEWKAVWKRFYSTQNLDIVLVNFDLLDKADISDRPTKALLNLGYAIEFHNQSGDIHDKIKRRIRRSDFKETSRGRFRYKQNLDEDWELVKMNECTPLLLDEN
ncbi:hypothetical protein FSP39_025193 [Pinctada imbricata]|uniref:TIR domain-containing protein n=1 Tax=Pinctada imbricata TaxID=66713 RepID=A0AA88Y5Q2_PINIB|nr:hypothetical protein FSP39_025193 [Pinctada imbricata]